MTFLELRNSASRYRFVQSCLGLAGCFFVCYAVSTPFWLKNKGLWAKSINNKSDQANSENEAVFNALEAERVFGLISCLMALSTGALCLVFALCWTSKTPLSYSNTRALLLAGEALYPTTLLLLTMGFTGFFFLLSWSFFTHQHREEILQDFSGLGSSYWLGALGWILLLVVEPIVFIIEQAVVENTLPDLEKSLERVWVERSKRPVSLVQQQTGHKSSNAPKRFLSEP
ncbi:uncharacterized protein LOC101158851 [Oryzias latipes]|uniref:uncharacterized protein LOC101158851 n=1 Tax=Oryzias latipes TaxID=8090 RepID=UPI0002A4AF4F|nr:uncharacterized protein LOC101158851 [Oryzias latipes]